MTLGLLTMSRQELDRAELMFQLRARRMTQQQVAEQLDLTLRQVERLYRAFKTGGAAALVSKKRGRPSARRLPDALRIQVVKIVRERYADFGPTFAHEKLTESHGVKVSVETLRQWMTAEGLWTPRAQRLPRPHQPRTRRACLGELIQIDGSDHEWFEARAPRCVLLVYIDDATSRLMELYFAESESAFSYFAATRHYLERHGKPVTFYSDKASIFRVNAKQPKGGEGSTQFSRALGELNIDILCANTPQAKGRVERANLTLQDRLVKELRLRGISSMEDANRYAPTFMADFNRKFARPPRSDHDAHRPLRSTDNLDEVFRWRETRTLTSNLTVHYRRHLYLLESSPKAYSLRGKLVEVHETDEGEITIQHGGVELPASVYRKEGSVRQQDVADNKYLSGILEKLRVIQLENDQANVKRLKTNRERRQLQASIDLRKASA